MCGRLQDDAPGCKSGLGPASAVGRSKQFMHECLEDTHWHGWAPQAAGWEPRAVRAILGSAQTDHYLPPGRTAVL